MQQFMIGQYGDFDAKKYHRDFRKDFAGIEACLFETEEDIQALVNEAEKHGFKLGIHFPFRHTGSAIRDALFLSPDRQEREEAFNSIEQELHYLANIRPSYVLFHYPKPVILDDRVDWSHWRFADKREYLFESSYSLDQFIQLSTAFFSWLTMQAERYSFIPVLELDALNRYVYELDVLVQLLEQFPKIKLCLDTGRLHLQAMLDPAFSAQAVFKKYARFTHVIHLWNLQYQNGIICNRYPVLPDCRVEDGWAPIEACLNILKAENPNVRILFEHRSELVSDEDLERCYQWVSSIIGT